MTLQQVRVASRLGTEALKTASPGFSEQRFMESINEPGIVWHKVVAHGPI